MVAWASALVSRIVAVGGSEYCPPDKTVSGDSTAPLATEHVTAAPPPNESAAAGRTVMTGGTK